jgi:hypothetical protein
LSSLEGKDYIDLHRPKQSHKLTGILDSRSMDETFMLHKNLKDLSKHKAKEKCIIKL